MSTSNATSRGGDGTDPAEVRPPMREALVAAAFRLFLERGYEQTTVDDIVALAGVGRRSFFRYFPSKEDVVFPDHERCLTDMEAFLARSPEDADPVRRVCDAARLVLRMYAENPAFSVQRYRLTKQVPGLRAYELSVVWRYERALAEYLRGRLGGRPDGILRADVIAGPRWSRHTTTPCGPGCVRTAATTRVPRWTTRWRTRSPPSAACPCRPAAPPPRTWWSWRRAAGRLCGRCCGRSRTRSRATDGG
ncbi:AcrR family transcriptional regulator [Streptomyces ambofaciens]